MLKVKSKNGAVYWLDPTNFVSMADGIFPDIADRMAIVISEKEAKYEKIPAIDAAKSKSFITKEYLIDKDNVNVVFDANLSGQIAYHFNGLGKVYSKRRLEDTFFIIANGYKIVWDNGSNKKKRRLKKKDIKAGKTIALLTELGFYDNNASSSINTPKKVEKKETKKNSVNDKDIVQKIKDLKELLDSGVLSDEEFKKAKKKLLN